MKNHIQPGEVLKLVAPYDCLSGKGAQIGSLFGVSSYDVLSGADGEFAILGVFNLVKVGSQAWTIGIPIYWDNTNKRCTSVSTSNLFIGHAAEALGAGAGIVLGKVRLHGASI